MKISIAGHGGRRTATMLGFRPHCSLDWHSLKPVRHTIGTGGFHMCRLTAPHGETKRMERPYI